MTVDEIREILGEAVTMRPPKFTPIPDGEPSPTDRQKIDRLQDYLLESAWMQSALEEALFYLLNVIARLKGEIDGLTGWEAVLPNKPAGRLTQADVQSAKRIAAPEIYEAGAEAKQLVEAVKRQIEKFRWEAGQGPISRAYTMIVGG